MKRKSRKKIICLLLAVVLVFTLAGCGGGNSNGGQSNASSGAGTAAEGGEQKGNPDGANEQQAMGRYVEEEIDLTELASSPFTNLCRREDGSLVALNCTGGYLVSKDEGVTWNDETPEWLREIDGWTSMIAMTPDGTCGISYYAGEEEINILVLSDGTQVPIEIPSTEENKYIRQIIATDDNRMLANVGLGNLYEVHKDGSCELLVETQTHASFTAVKGNLVFMDSDGSDGKMPVIYDMEAGGYIEDDALMEFVNGSYGERYYNGSYDCTMYMLPGEERVLYLIGNKGIHRHAIGGNMMEQIVDGSLSMLSNPSYSIASAMQLENNVFLVLFSNGKLLRLTYDPNVSAVPEKMLKIYSLKENNDLRQIIALYQSQNPDVYISYQIGMEEGSSVTREDAVKKLNTEIMAGTGPDLIVMDGLPFTSYVQKGVLLDITDYLKEYSAGTPLFDNIIEALKVDGKAYVAPATISLPKLIGRGDVLDKITDLSNIGEAVEILREEHPGDDIIGICSGEGVMNRFAPVSAPGWVNADGTVNRDNIKEFLEECKRIYDAQLDGIRTEVTQQYAKMNEWYLGTYNQSMDRMDWSISSDIIDYIAGEAYLLSGWLETYYSYSMCNSLDRKVGYEESRMESMQDRCSNVFMPQTMLGISAVSPQIDFARLFMDFFLSTSVQESCYGFPINQEAYDKQFTPKEGDVGENGEYGSFSLSSQDGESISYEFYWPEDAKIAELKAEIASVNTAYIHDEVLEDAVFKRGASYIRGELTLDRALDEIENEIAIYMAE